MKRENQQAKNRYPPEPKKIKGVLSKSGVTVSAGDSVQNLASRGYGTVEDNKLNLNFYEALFLQSKEILTVTKEKTRKIMSFQEILRWVDPMNQNVWAKYLIYRDWRSRGYVVKDGFGLGIDFRVYERGKYGKATATYLILGIQEGKPLSARKLARILKHVQSLKKKLVLTVVNRRGEIVNYSLSKLTMK